MKRVVIFGQSDVTEEATRNTTLCAAFDVHADKIVDCTIQFGFAPPGTKPFMKLMYAVLFTPFRWVCLCLKYLFLPAHDLIFVPYPSYVDGWLGCLLGKINKKKVVIDSFLGIYDTIVRDRCLFSEKSLLAKMIWLYEKTFLSAADYILVDTDLNGEIFQRDYHLPKARIKTIPVGINETLWRPTQFPGTPKFKVIFWCTFIPLHGAEVVAKAAHLLEKKCPDIEFLVIGTGQLSSRFDSLLKNLQLSNLRWIPRFIPLKTIYAYVGASNCCLGIFGNTKKTQRVIPYKVYQALASGKAVITARTSASESLFTHKKNAILVNPDNPDDLADAIQSLQEDAGFANDLGRKGRVLYETHLSCDTINRKIGELLAQG